VAEQLQLTPVDPGTLLPTPRAAMRQTGVSSWAAEATAVSKPYTSLRILKGRSMARVGAGEVESADGETVRP
jgi:hypothetical protein